MWFTILTQLSSHLSINAGKPRSYFTAHKAQKVKVFKDGAMDTVDLGQPAVRTTHETDGFIVDESLGPRIVPDSTTTTESDTVTTAMLTTGVMQKFFSYTMELTSGILSVTLLREKDDWVKIRRRLDELGTEPGQFAPLLKLILNYFIRSGRELLSFRVEWALASGPLMRSCCIPPLGERWIY